MLDSRSTDVVIRGKEYRIGVFSPVVGGLVALQLNSMLSNEAIYSSVLKNCLEVVSVIKERDNQKFPFKMYSKEKDCWIEAKIRYPFLLNRLLKQVTKCNLAPFIQATEEPNDISSPQDILPFNSPIK